MRDRRRLALIVLLGLMFSPRPLPTTQTAHAAAPAKPAVLSAPAAPASAPASAPLRMGPALAAMAGTTSPPPLPRSCIGGGTPLNYSDPICCVSGYVYLNGAPVAGAQVMISTGQQTITVHTQSGPGSAQPYYSASLDTAPLNVQPSETITVTATAGGQTKAQTFVAQEGGRQEDIILPQSAVAATWAQGEQLMPPRREHAAAYETTRQRVVVFGGEIGRASCRERV